MADPFHKQKVERIADRGMPGRLAGVGDGVQPGGAGTPEIGGEGMRRVANLVATETERDDASLRGQRADPSTVCVTE